MSDKSKLKQDIESRKAKKALKKTTRTQAEAIHEEFQPTTCNWSELSERYVEVKDMLDKFRKIHSVAVGFLSRLDKDNPIVESVSANTNTLGEDLKEYYDDLSDRISTIPHTSGEVAIDDLPNYYLLYEQTESLFLDITTVLSGISETITVAIEKYEA